MHDNTPAPVIYNLVELERNAILGALGASTFLTEASKLLGVSRHALKRRMLRYGIVFDNGKISFKEPPSEPTEMHTPPPEPLPGLV